MADMMKELFIYHSTEQKLDGIESLCGDISSILISWDEFEKNEAAGEHKSRFVIGIITPSSGDKVFSMLPTGIIKPHSLIGIGFNKQIADDQQKYFFELLPKRAGFKSIADAIKKSLIFLQLIKRTEDFENLAEHNARELTFLNQIGIALSAERNINRLLDLILEKALEISGSDAGSLYLVEDAEEKEIKRLRFKHTKNRSLDVPFQEFTLPINDKSLAGYVALTGKALNIEDAYEIPDELPFRHKRAFDEQFGYRTTSLLVIPMKNHKDEVVGVLQLINRKREPHLLLRVPQDFEDNVITYNKRQEELVSSLASQAAVCIENNILNQNIESLFEGFIRASILAIEQRDPPTSGHSARVAALTCALAEKINQVTTGPYADTYFTQQQLKELRYAGLVHDFGKVGVREEVLVKAKKLYPHDLEMIRDRFRYIRSVLLIRHYQKKCELIQAAAGIDERQARLAELDKELEAESLKQDDFLAKILKANEPTILAQDVGEEILKISKESYIDLDGSSHPYLTEEEVKYLRIPKGSLSDEERREIESHAENTFRFLLNIPWTQELSHVCEIAHSHHEKINGKGYPQGLNEQEISIQSKMMAVADIFDALTAADRPYKKAVPVDKALQILNFEVKDRHLDPELVRIFTDEKVYEVVKDLKPGALNL